VSARKFIIGAALLPAGLAGGSVAASDYPPTAPPPSIAQPSSVGGAGSEAPAERQGTTGQLPATGSDAAGLIMIAGGAVAAGAGLLVVTRRRRPAATS
jgi:LPXTG-motif cell wall-anchored protein